MNWCIECYVLDGDKIVNPCGTDWTMIYYDLKTLAGVKRRMRKWYPLRKLNRTVVEIRIWSYSDNNKYNRDKWRCADVISGWELIDLLNRQDENFNKK